MPFSFVHDWKRTNILIPALHPKPMMYASQQDRTGPGHRTLRHASSMLGLTSTFRCCPHGQVRRVWLVWSCVLDERNNGFIHYDTYIYICVHAHRVYLYIYMYPDTFSLIETVVQYASSCKIMRSALCCDVILRKCAWHGQVLIGLVFVVFFIERTGISK